MRYLIAWCGVVVLAAALAAGGGPSRSISKIALEDKIRGGWAGKMIGVSYGAPTEFRSNGAINEGAITWSPERVSNALDQDDLYVGMTMAEMMDRLGFDATVEQYGEAFKASRVRPVARQRRRAAAPEPRHQGADVRPPAVQHPRQRHRLPDRGGLHRPDEPGPAARVQQVLRPRRPRHELRRRPVRRHVRQRDVHRGVLRDATCARVVEQGLACLPPESGYARLIRDVLDWSAQYPDDWKKHLAAHRGQVGPRRQLPGRRAPALQHRRQHQRRLHRARPALRPAATSPGRSRSPRARARTRTATRRRPAASSA